MNGSHFIFFNAYQLACMFKSTDIIQSLKKNIVLQPLIFKGDENNHTKQKKKNG